MTDQTKFSVVCSLFEWMQRSKSSAKKRSKFRKFLDNFCKPNDYFSAIRLILPYLDRERGTYGLKESGLATCLIDALGMSRESEDALRLINWRKGGPKTGANVGNFALVAFEVLQRRQGTTSGGLTIKELNELLDSLASSESRTEKVSVFSSLIKKTNAQEMKWIVMIILKDLKLGISEKSIFQEFHPDAEDLFNVTCDLKLVCEKLKDRTQRHKRQDIEVGKAVRPQLALRVGDAAAAWKKLHGKEVVVECKFDGDRIQIHKNGAEIHFFSRNFLDHTEYQHAMSDVVKQNILVDRCILDGEMLVWDVSLNRFAEFGSNQEIAKAAKEGLDSDRQLCYVAFDILYVGDTSVIHQTLKERHELLQKVVKPLKGRLEILVPYGGLNAHRPSGEPCWSLVAHNVDDVEKFFKETIENRDEGIVLKDLGSKWEPSDRSGKWLKLKPEYIRAGSDLDVLIIGGYFGSGRRGGQVAQFLVGLAERSAPNTYPRRFISFCRVGTGLSDDELDAVVTKLKPYFRKYDYPKKGPPNFYQVTNSSKERPDVWIDSPEKSIILSITSDIRTIRSEVFAAPYSLRFPRIDRVRYDKPWHECLDVQSFAELVNASNGTTQGGKDHGFVESSKTNRMKTVKKGEKKNLAVVPSQFSKTDVSDIKRESLIFANLMFYFVNVPPTHSLESLHKMVAENGGTFSMNLNDSVTHSIAAEIKGLKFKAAKLRGDVIHISWVLECCSQRKLLPLQPKYFLFLSDSTKEKLQEEIDEFSDSYYCDLDMEDFKQLLGNVEKVQDCGSDYYKKKYCPEERWSRFHDCSVFFHPIIQSPNPSWEIFLEIVMRRLKLEVCMGGGKVCDNLSHATHLVVLSVPAFDVEFQEVLGRFSEAEKRFLYKGNLHVVGSQWLQDCLDKEQKLREENYSLKPRGLEKFDVGKWNEEPGVAPSNVRNQKLSASPWKAEEKSPLTSPMKDNSKRKRGRRIGTSKNKGKKAAPNPAPRARVRHEKKPSKICQTESEESASSDEQINKEDTKMKVGNHESNEAVNSRSQKLKGSESPSKKPAPKLAPRTRIRRGNKPSKVNKNGSEESALSDEKTKKEDTKMKTGHNETYEMMNTESSKIQEYGMIREENQGKVHGAPSGTQDGEKIEKLEVMVDPIQAMLLDMIPSLGIKKAETGKSSDPENLEAAPVDTDAGPAKKRKVSYKDVAGELLKDW